MSDNLTISTREAARILECTQANVSRVIKEGRIDAIWDEVEGRYVIDHDSVLRYRAYIKANFPNTTRGSRKKASSSKKRQQKEKVKAAVNAAAPRRSDAGVATVTVGAITVKVNKFGDVSFETGPTFVPVSDIMEAVDFAESMSEFVKRWEEQS